MWIGVRTIEIFSKELMKTIVNINQNGPPCKIGPLTFKLSRFLKYLPAFLWLESSNYSRNRFLLTISLQGKIVTKNECHHTDEYWCKLRILRFATDVVVF